MKLPDEDILNLPNAPDFISQPPVYTAGEMALRCEKLLPYWNTLRYQKPEPPFLGSAFVLVGEDAPEDPSKQK